MLFPEGDAKIKAQFDKSVNDQHLIYYYDAKNPETGAAEKWKYEMHFYSDDRINYKIHGGPMAGRVNYQKADYQMIREDIWQCNWLEGEFPSDRPRLCTVQLLINLLHASYRDGHRLLSRLGHDQQANHDAPQLLQGPLGTGRGCPRRQARPRGPEAMEEAGRGGQEPGGEVCPQ